MEFGGGVPPPETDSYGGDTDDGHDRIYGDGIGPGEIAFGCGMTAFGATMNLRFSQYLVVLTTVALACSISSAQQAKTPSAEAWNKIDDHVSAAALTAFVTKFPDSVEAADAKLYLGLAHKIEDIRSGKTKPDLVISFEALSSSWMRALLSENAAMASVISGESLPLTGGALKGPITFSRDHSQLPEDKMVRGWAYHLRVPPILMATDNRCYQ